MHFAVQRAMHRVSRRAGQAGFVRGRSDFKLTHDPPCARPAERDPSTGADSLFGIGVCCLVGHLSGGFVYSAFYCMRGLSGAFLGSMTGLFRAVLYVMAFVLHILFCALTGVLRVCGNGEGTREKQCYGEKRYFHNSIAAQRPAKKVNCGAARFECLPALRAWQVLRPPINCKW